MEGEEDSEVEGEEGQEREGEEEGEEGEEELDDSAEDIIILGVSPDIGKCFAQVSMWMVFESKRATVGSATGGRRSALTINGCTREDRSDMASVFF